MTVLKRFQYSSLDTRVTALEDAGSSGGVSDGDKGDIVVSSGGTVWALDAAVTASFAAASHSHAASAITSGTIDTARLGSGPANSSSYLRGDQTWATIAGGDTPATKNVLTANTTIAAGYSAYIPSFAEIANTISLEIGLNSVLEIG